MAEKIETIEKEAEKKETVKKTAAKKPAAKAAEKPAAEKKPVKKEKAEAPAEKKPAAKTEEKPAVKAAEKSAAEKKLAKKEKLIKVTLVKSVLGSKKDQIATCEALGLKKVRQYNIIKDNAATRGMIYKVRHLVAVTEVVQNA